MKIICPTGCGQCCRHVAHLLDLLPPEWPVNPDGSCGHLTPENRCDIYAARPTVCRVEAARPPGIDESAWLHENAAACTVLQDLADMDTDFYRPSVKQ